MYLPVFGPDDALPFGQLKLNAFLEVAHFESELLFLPCEVLDDQVLGAHVPAGVPQLFGEGLEVVEFLQFEAVEVVELLLTLLTDFHELRL